VFRFEIDSGIFPFKLLFARTIAELLEPPNVSGSAPTKKLLLTKIASRGFEKSPLGNVP
jgi:hypothetical protein